MHGVVPGSVLATLAGAVAGLLGSRVDGTGAVRLTAHPTQASKRAQAKRVPSAPSAMWKRARRRCQEQDAEPEATRGAERRQERPRGRQPPARARASRAGERGGGAAERGVEPAAAAAKKSSRARGKVVM